MQGILVVHSQELGSVVDFVHAMKLDLEKRAVLSVVGGSHHLAMLFAESHEEFPDEALMGDEQHVAGILIVRVGGQLLGQHVYFGKQRTLSSGLLIDKMVEKDLN
jgi:hypothetical protein